MYPLCMHRTWIETIPIDVVTYMITQQFLFDNEALALAQTGKCAYHALHQRLMLKDGVDASKWISALGKHTVGILQRVCQVRSIEDLSWLAEPRKFTNDHLGESLEDFS